MHVPGFPVDPNWFFQFLVTTSIIVFGLLYLVKNMASKHFVVDANFDASDTASSDGDRKMQGSIAKGDSCVVCGNLTKKQCAGCKSVRYCSEACQSSHWRSGHKTKCKEFQSSGNLNSMQPTSMQRRRRSSTAVALVPASGTTTTLKQLEKILFPYEDFVELFNWDKQGYPPCGLLNCGNSCFANVVLQCLAYTRPLVAYLLEKSHQRECRRNDWCFLCEFQTHVERATDSRHPFSPINILSRLPNIGSNLDYGKQEDAHEFMRFAIDTMQSVCLDEFGGEKALHPSSQETTLIQHIFGGHLQSQVICTKCNNVSNQYENMMDLTVEIQGDAASLEECLDQFTVTERLHGDNMYKCDGCNDYVMAWKRLTVRRAPNILTIALKRFQSGRFGKLNKRVTFPETLDLKPYMSEAGDDNDIYKLYAVVVHVDMLNASYFGHYICYTKDFSGNWYRIDDCKVTTVELNEVLLQGAYMLLYSRVCAQPSCLKPIDLLRKEELQMVKVEVESFPEQSVGCFTMAESINHVEISDSLASDSILQEAKVSRYERELSSITNFEDARKDLDIVYSGSSSSITKNIEINGNGHSDAAKETVSPVEHAQRLVSGIVSPPTETYMPEVYFLNSKSLSPDSGVEAENRAENSGAKKFMLMDSSTQRSLPAQNGICEEHEMSDDASIACLSTSEEVILNIDSEGELEEADSGKDLTSAFNVNSGSNGFAKPGFPTSFEEQAGKYLNEDENVLGESSKSFNLCNGDSNAPIIIAEGINNVINGNRQLVGKALTNDGESDYELTEAFHSGKIGSNSKKRQKETCSLGEDC